MSIKRIAFLFILNVFALSYAQDELDFKPRLDFSDGLGMRTSDSSVMINFRFRMQNRAGVYTKSISNLNIDEVEARVRRLRLRMDGYLINPKFSYYIQLSFSRGDQDLESTGVPNVVRDAVFFYFFKENLFLSLGQTKLPGNRQRVISSGMQQFAERSIVNGTFNIDRDFGLRLFHSWKVQNQVFRSQWSISSGEGRNALNSDNGLAYTGRLEYLPLGKFVKDGDYFEGDLMREEKPKFALGITANYNDKAIRTGGTIGAIMSNPTHIRTLIGDMVYKWRGFALSAEYFYRNSNEIPNIGALNANQVFVYNGVGTNIQMSYLFKNNIEIAGRFAQIKPSNEMLSYDRGANELVLGLIKYLNGHRTKVQLNALYNNKSYFWSERNDRFGLMLQFEIGI